MKINHILPQESKYLQVLRNIAKPPKKLHYAGILPEDRLTSLAIVGTRKPTNYGREVTMAFASEIARSGVMIVSGLALGTDAIAHRAALEAKGKTIAVLGNGLPAIYPASHRGIAEEIVQNDGAILSEYGENAPALPHQFLERNRLVSGISDAILITKAATKSGTMSTAMHALEQGKEVFVIPGNITSPMSAGCNALIRQGATPVTDPQQILEIIMPATQRNQPRLLIGDTEAETIILKLLESGVRDGDELLQASKLDASEFSVALTMLEINDHIRALGANQWTLK